MKKVFHFSVYSRYTVEVSYPLKTWRLTSPTRQVTLYKAGPQTPRSACARCSIHVIRSPPIFGVNNHFVAYCATDWCQLFVALLPDITTRVRPGLLRWRDIMQHLLKTKQKFSFTLVLAVRIQQQTYMQNNIISHCLHFGAVNVRGKERICIMNCGIVRCMKGVTKWF